MCSKEDPVQPKINKLKKKKEGWEGQRQRETGDAALLAVKMEGGAASQGCGASSSWKRQELMLP